MSLKYEERIYYSPGSADILQNRCGVSHVHELAGWTTFEDGHFHSYRLCPSIAVSTGAHVHYFLGPTAMVEDHAHELEAATMASEEEP